MNILTCMHFFSNLYMHMPKIRLCLICVSICLSSVCLYCLFLFVSIHKCSQDFRCGVHSIVGSNADIF